MDKLNETLKLKTKKCYTIIAAGLDPKGHVLDTLFAEEVITAKQHKEINDGPDVATRAVNLLSHLFQTSHPQAFVVFREALKKDYGWIGDLIDIAGVTNVAIPEVQQGTTGSGGVVNSEANRNQTEESSGPSMPFFPKGVTNVEIPEVQQGTTGSGGVVNSRTSLVNSDANRNQTEESSGPSRHSFPKSQSILLGVFQVVIGVVAMVAAIISKDLVRYSYATILPIVSGVGSVVSGFLQKKSWAVGQAVLSIISACGLAIALVFGVVDLCQHGANNEVAIAMLITMGILLSIVSTWTAGIGCHYAGCKRCCPCYSEN